MLQRSMLELTETHTHTHTHTHPLKKGPFFPGLPGWAGTKKVKPVWIILKQETVSGSGISWAICKSAPRSSQLPAPHHSVFNRPDALPAVHAGTRWLKKGAHSVWYTGSHRQLNKVDNTCNNERLITLHHHAHESSCRTGLSVANCLSLFQNHCSQS